jgi:hypothetical protein
MPFPIGLTDRGKMIGAAVLLGGVVLVFAYLAGRRHGEQLAVLGADTKAAQVAHDSVVVAVHRADSLERVTRDLVHLVALAQKPHLVAKGRTDVAAGDAKRVASIAEQAAADERVTADSLRTDIRALATADSLLQVRFVTERDVAQKRLMLDSLALTQAMAAIGEKDHALVVAAQNHVADQRVITDLRRLQPSRFGSIMRGAAWVGLGILVGRAVH